MSTISIMLSRTSGEKRHVEELCDLDLVVHNLAKVKQALEDEDKQGDLEGNGLNGAQDHEEEDIYNPKDVHNLNGEKTQPFKRCSE